MVESLSAFPFPKLRHYKLLTLEMLLFIEKQDALNFMFYVNQAGRTFLEQQFVTIINGFINSGLVTFKFNGSLKDYVELEKLYFKALTRRIGNRVLTIEFNTYKIDLRLFNEIFNWIKV